jgi:hypothetical protein
MRHSVFTVETCVRLDLAPHVLEQLRPIVQGAPQNVTRDEAWRRHAAAADVLLQYFDNIDRGCWEYFDDEARAKAMFDDWCRPVIERMIPRQEPSGIPDYRNPGPRYALFTMVYLLARDSPSDLQVRRACRISDDLLWTRRTFRHLLGAVRELSFASVRSDCMYMTPRDHEWGLTVNDLASSTYQYLRTLQGD